VSKEILDAIKALDKKIEDLMATMQPQYVKVSDIARECGVKVQNVHYQLNHNPELEPDKDFFKRGNKYLITLSAANKIKKVWAKND